MVDWGGLVIQEKGFDRRPCLGQLQDIFLGEPERILMYKLQRSETRNVKERCKGLEIDAVVITRRLRLH